MAKARTTDIDLPMPRGGKRDPRLPTSSPGSLLDDVREGWKTFKRLRGTGDRNERKRLRPPENITGRRG